MNSKSNPVCFLASHSSTPCGIEMFNRGLAGAWAATSDANIYKADSIGELGGLWRAMALEKAALVVSLPVVAWKKQLALPLLALVVARLRGARTVAILHEWDDLHPLRRFFVGIYTLFAGSLLLSSPQVRDAFLLSWAGRFKSKRVGLVPIPPNLPLPGELRPTAATARLDAESAAGKLILGHFGSIYPKKHSGFTLDVASALKKAGRKVFVIFVGDFIKGMDSVEADFFAHAQRLGLQNDMLVTGYVQTAEEIFALFARIDAFVARFPEGLTSRRTSILTPISAGRPVFVNAPQRADEFDHHVAFREAIDLDLALILPAEAGAESYAEAIGKMTPVPVETREGLYARAWREAAKALETALN
jgi:hypothetical protein